jgi:hypothetical protein
MYVKDDDTGSGVGPTPHASPARQGASLSALLTGKPPFLHHEPYIQLSSEEEGGLNL